MSKKYTIEDYNVQMQNRGLNIVAVKEFFENGESYFECRCNKCGNTFLRKRNDMSNYKDCPACVGILERFNYEKFERQWNEFNPKLHLYVKDRVPQGTCDKAPIICHCDVCGGEYESNIPNLKMAIKRNKPMKGCKICAGKIIVNGMNDLLTKRPDLEPYIVDKDEVVGVGVCSKKKIKVKCPDCGHIKEQSVAGITRRGISCPICGDGISIPNKFLRNILLQLENQIDNLQFEYISEWTQTKKYDGYFVYNDQEYVVEIDGLQHNRDCMWATKEEQQANDRLKDDLAKQNGIKMIRIECYKSDFDYMRECIEQSKLGEIFDLSVIDWDKCNKNITKSQIVEVSQYYNTHNNLSPKDLAKVFRLSKNTIRDYLYIGTKLGLCKYSADESKKQGNVKSRNTLLKNSNKDFSVYKNGDCVGNFMCKRDCVETLNQKYIDLTFTTSKIEFALHTGELYNGFSFKYNQLTLQEYHKDNEYIKPVCKCYNENPYQTLKNIAQKFSISAERITEYLAAGKNLGLCNYNSKEHIQNTFQQTIDKVTALKNQKYPVYVYDKEYQFIGLYYGYSECARQLRQLYSNTIINGQNISEQFIKVGDVAHCREFIISKQPLDLSKERNVI